MPVSPSTTQSVRWLRVTSIDGLEALEDLWRASESEIESPLGRFSWVKCCLAVFSEGGDPHVIGAARGEKLVAVAPLVKKRCRGISRLLVCGVAELCERQGLIAVEEPATLRLIKRLLRSGTPLHFEGVRADSTSIQALVRACRGRAIVVERPQDTRPYIMLDDSWCAPEQHLTVEHRGELCRARRNAEEQGPVKVEIHAPDLDELPELLDLAFEIEARSWTPDSGAPLVHDADRAAFYRRYSEAACVEGTLRICFLRIGDRVAAVQIALEDARALWLLKTGHDQRFARCAPGMLLMRETIRYAAEAGLETYECLGSAEDWTRAWSATQHKTISVHVYPFGLRGMAALAVDHVAAFRK